MTAADPAVPPSAVPTATAALPGGGAMPLLGFGTWQITGRSAQEATEAALEAGYRHLDTATIYGNEREVGAGLRASGVARDEVFVTTKCPPDKAGQARSVLQKSLELLDVEQVDLWLIHWPGAGLPLWETFLAAREDGLTRDVGVSNYSVEMLDELERATGVLPAVNQIKWSPLLYDAAVEQGHRDRGVVLEGYSALRGGTLDHPVITGLAERLGRTPTQVIVRWHLEHGTVVIPKSSSPDRIRSNAQVGDLALSAEDVAALDALGR